MRLNLVNEVNGTNCVKPLLMKSSVTFQYREDKIGTFWLLSNFR